VHVLENGQETFLHLHSEFVALERREKCSNKHKVGFFPSVLVKVNQQPTFARGS
jgi:hypothetical protein